MVSGDISDIDVHSSGLGLVMLVQYSSSPAGPYDELLYALPCQHPTDGFEVLATRNIPVIYVSSECSVTNGRLNWGVPKNLAQFHWHIEEGYIFSKTTLTVTAVSDEREFPSTAQSTSDIIPTVSMYTLNLLPIFVHLGLLRWACPLFMQQQLNAEGQELPGDMWHAYKLGGYGWARPCLAFQPSSSSSSPSSLFPSLKTLGVKVGIELQGNLVMPVTKEVVVSQAHKEREGGWAHRRRVACVLGVFGYLIYCAEQKS